MQLTLETWPCMSNIWWQNPFKDLFERCKTCITSSCRNFQGFCPNLIYSQHLKIIWKPSCQNQICKSQGNMSSIKKTQITSMELIGNFLGKVTENSLLSQPSFDPNPNPNQYIRFKATPPHATQPCFILPKILTFWLSQQNKSCLSILE